MDKHEYDNSSEHTDDNSSPRADDISSRCTDDNSSLQADENASQRAENDSSQSAADDDIRQNEVSHVQLPTVGEKYHVKHDAKTLRKLVYGPSYVPYNEDGQKLLLP